jgi:hypothetical protein
MRDSVYDQDGIRSDMFEFGGSQQQTDRNRLLGQMYASF